MSGWMRLLSRLALRDMRHHPMESVMVFAVIAAAAATLTIAFALSGVTNSPYQQTRAATNGPDVIAEVFSGLPQASSRRNSVSSDAGSARGAKGADAIIASLIGAPGVVAHSGPYRSVFGTIAYRGESAAVVAEGRTRAPSAVDQPKLSAGSWIRPGGVVLERGFAEALHANVGEHLELDHIRLRVVGIAVTAGVPAYPSSLCHLACLTSVRQNMGLVWVPRAVAARLAHGAAASAYLLNLKLSDAAGSAAFVAAHDGVSVGSSAAVLYAWQSVRAADASLIQVEQLALQFGGWVLELLALAGLAVLVGRRMTEQTRRVGLLKAVGATPGLLAAVLLVEHLVLAAAGAGAGLAAGVLIAPALADPGAGLLGNAGTPSLSATTAVVVGAVALGAAGISSIFPAMRAARTSTIAALADMPRVPRRRPVLVALSARLPVPLLIGIRQLARRPRRAVLGALSVTVTVTGVVAILVGSASTHASGGGSIGNLKIERLDELMRIITVMLLILSAINTMFIAWATASDGRFASALQRALGATTRQVTSGLSLAALLPALPAALLGLPLGVGVYHLLDPGDPRTTTPLWGSLAVVIAAPLCVAALTAIPSRLGAQRSPTQTLHGD